MKKIKITLHKDGTQKVEVTGAVGQECTEFTSELEKRLGVTDDRQFKPEYYEAENEQEQEGEQEAGS